MPLSGKPAYVVEWGSGWIRLMGIFRVLAVFLVAVLIAELASAGPAEERRRSGGKPEKAAATSSVFSDWRADRPVSGAE